MNFDAGSGIAASARPGPELEEASVELHGVIVLDGAVVLEGADAVEVPKDRGRAPGGLGVDGLVAVETNRYSIPLQHIGQEVDILPGPDDTLRIYRAGHLIAAHPRRPGRDGVVVDEAHAHGLAALSGLRTAPSWRDRPLPDVEVRDLAIYERLEAGEVAHA